MGTEQMWADALIFWRSSEFWDVLKFFNNYWRLQMLSILRFFFTFFPNYKVSKTVKTFFSNHAYVLSFLVTFNNLGWSQPNICQWISKSVPSPYFYAVGANKPKPM